ncbi:hypothetical protein BJX96DRAFT_142671 [Aspergillus floccosus]
MCNSEGASKMFVRLLLEEGADVGAKGQVNRTPLLYPALGGHEHILELILDHGASIEDRDALRRNIKILSNF